MRVVDPHVHFWDPGKVPISWLDNPKIAYSGDNRYLPKLFTPDALKALSGDVEVLKCVHIEAIADDALAEARWVQSIADQARIRIGIVAFADLSAPTFSEHLDQLLACRQLRGIRQVLNVHANPAYTYVKRRYLREPNWQRNLNLLGQHKLSFDLQMYPSQVADAVQVTEQHPDVTFILNHTGMFVDRNAVDGWRAWRNGLRELAKCRNVVAKISGLAMFDHHWTAESFRPYVLEAISAFGVSRCMFASNFPIDGLHASYESLWHAYAKIVSGLRNDEHEALFVGNAERIYRI